MFLVGFGFGEIRLLEIQDDRFLGNRLVLRAMAAGLAAVPHNLAALVEEKFRVRASRVVGHELELFPERLQLFLPTLVEQQLAERRVVAGVAHHVVEAGAEEASLVFRSSGYKRPRSRT